MGSNKELNLIAHMKTVKVGCKGRYRIESQIYQEAIEKG